MGIKNKEFKSEILVDKFGCGNVAVIKEQGLILDLFIDLKDNSQFYHRNTILIAMIQRVYKKGGGFFILLPNGHAGFLVSKKDYPIGKLVIVMTKGFNEEKIQQIFTDELKIETSLFVFTSGSTRLLFSKKLKNRESFQVLEKALYKLTKHHSVGCSVIVRSNTLSLSKNELSNQFEKGLENFLSIKKFIPNERKVLTSGLKAVDILFNQYKGEKYKIFEVHDIFEQQGVWDEIYLLRQEKIFFGNDSYLLVNNNTANLSFDVNSGNDFSITNEELNLKAATHIARVIRILGIGGKIVVDFVPCSSKSRKKIFGFFKKNFQSDITKTVVYGWTKMGNFEIERARSKIPIDLVLD